jgi:alpha-L-arabinofuranosidase
MYDGTVGDFAGHMRTNVIPVLDEADPGKKIKLIVDEWGDWLLGDNWMQTGTLMNALSAANQLHLMMSNADRIEVACIAQGISVIHSLLNINTSSEMVKTPTFYVFKMFKPHHSNGAKWAPITASNIETSKQSAEVSGSVTLPMLTVGSTVNADGRVNISVNNIDPASSRKIVISLTSNQTEYLIDSAQIVTGPATNSNNPFGGAEVVNLQNFAASNYTLGANGKTLTATLPARSIVMFRLKPPPVGVGIKRDEKANGLSIATGSRGTLIIKSPVDRMTPVKISLFSVDGKTLMKTFSANVTPGNENIIRLVGDHSPGTGMFIVQVEAGGVVQAKRIMY